MGKQIESNVRLLSFTPTIDTSAYAANDQLGSLVEIPNFIDESSGGAKIVSLTVCDKSTSGAQMRVLFFRDKPTISSTDNSPLDISDDEVADKFLGYVPVASGDYINLAGGRIATVRNVNLAVTSRKGPNNLTGRSVWAIVQSNGTPTYGTTTDLVFYIGVE